MPTISGLRSVGKGVMILLWSRELLAGSVNKVDLQVILQTSNSLNFHAGVIFTVNLLLKVLAF